MQFYKGQRVRVRATGQKGSINYQRLGGPDYRDACMVSVILDSQVRVGYVGTAYNASEVEPVEETELGDFVRRCIKCTAYLGAQNPGDTCDMCKWLAKR